MVGEIKDGLTFFQWAVFGLGLYRFEIFVEWNWVVDTQHVEKCLITRKPLTIV